MHGLVDGPTLLDRGVLSLVGGRSIFKAAPFPCFCWVYKIESRMVRWAKQNPVWDRAAPVQQEQGALLPQLQLLQGAWPSAKETPGDCRVAAASLFWHQPK